MKECDGSYWDRWDAEVAPKLQDATPTSHEKPDPRVKFTVTSTCLKAMLAYFAEQLARRRNDASVKMALKYELNKAEVAVRKEILFEWAALAEEEKKKAEDKEAKKKPKNARKHVKAGILETLQAYELHFTYKTACKALYNEEFDEAPVDTLCMHADFGEHDSLPVGPKETSGFFYANAVLGVTMLVIIVWSRKLGKKYFTFCSDVREQSSLFVVSCVQHILSQVDVRSYTHLHWWSDIGPHFLSTRWLGFWLVHLVREYKTNCHMRFFPAGHGKGPCDGHVARVKKWKRTAAKKIVIASVKTYVTVMSDRATALKKNVPSTPDYIFVDWTPPEKNLLPDVVLSTEELKNAAWVFGVPTVGRVAGRHGAWRSASIRSQIPQAASP